MTHTSIEAIELARNENVSIIKFPAHCTDLLQPLNVSCFAPLKYFYKKALLKHIQKTGRQDKRQEDKNCKKSTVCKRVKQHMETWFECNKYNFRV